MRSDHVEAALDWWIVALGYALFAGIGLACGYLAGQMSGMKPTDTTILALLSAVAGAGLMHWRFWK